MKQWKIFELKCFEYLKNNFSRFAQFTMQGGSDSTTADIQVHTQNNKMFYLETKHCPAQCGQFVLFANQNTRNFDYSAKNITTLNSYYKSIIDYMNQDFEGFKNASTRSKKIEFENSSEIFAKWIIETYKQKNVKFFITNNYQIIPLTNITDYFNITARYRVKRSGSRKISKKDISIIRNYISGTYNLNNFIEINDRLYVQSALNLHNTKFNINGNEYMFSVRNQYFEIRKLSNTFNANVIFSITLKPNINGLSVEEFINFLVSYC